MNKILRLSPLAERYASDMTGKDTRKKGGPRGGSSGKGGGRLKESLSSYLRRAQQVYRHEPQELCVAVNGYLQSTQKISSPLNELTLIVDTAEQIGFVEVFSEQGVRLLLLNIEPLPTGPVRQDASVELSEGRTLDASLSFSGAWPTLHVTYQDPLAQDLQEQMVDEDLLIRPSSNKATEAVSTAKTSVLNSQSPAINPHRARLLFGIGEWAKQTFRASFWLRPATITAVFAVLLIAAFVLLWRSKPQSPLSAADVLQRAAQAEEVVSARPDTVIHRTFQIEERRGSLEGEVLVSQRVELWQSAVKGIAARRLYDSSGRLVAGEWVNKDNAVTIYHHGVKPQVRPSKQPETQLDRDNVWRLSPSAKDFAAIVGESQALGLEERSNHYVLTFASGSPSAERGLIKATLVISRDDLHAIEQTLVVQQNAEIRVYWISETSFERRPVNAVAPAVFEPEPELLGEVERIKTEETTKETAIAGPSAPPVLATPELEIEVLRLLNSAGGDLSDQVSVTRTSDGRLRVEGTVETSRRKAEILHALSSVASHPAVKISVETVAEVEQEQSTKENSRTIELQRVEIAKAALPIEPELRRYFAGKGLSPEQLEEEITKFASRIMRRSLQTRLHARTLKQTMNRFSPDDLRALTPEARQKLMTLIREQAVSLHSEIAGLRNELQAVVPGSGASVEQAEIISDADLLRAINRMGELVSQTDTSVRASFSLSSESSGAAPVKDAQFWRSLKSAESLAQKISRQ